MYEKLKDEPDGAGDPEGADDPERAGDPENHAGIGHDDYVRELPEGYENPEDMFFWKDNMTDNFHLWIDNLREIPTLPDSGMSEEPDLYSFYEQLCVLRSEFRKNSRRSHETFSQFGDHLGEFQVVLDSLAKRLERIATEQDSTAFLARQGIFVQMVELFERLRWLGRKLKENTAAPQKEATVDRLHFLQKIKGLFAASPQKTTDDIRESISESIKEGLSLILSHFEEFLASEGVAPIKTTGMAFDPAFMMALGTVETDAYPPNTVFEEISGGYRYGKHILKLAKVIVAKRKEI